MQRHLASSDERKTIGVASFLDGCLERPEPLAAPPQRPLESDLVPLTLSYSRIPIHLMRDVETTSRPRMICKEAGRKQKIIKNVMFNSRIFLVNRSQGLEKKKKEHSRM